MILTAIWHILTDLKPYTPEGFLDSRPVNKEKVLTTSQALNLLKQRGYFYQRRSFVSFLIRCCVYIQFFSHLKMLICDVKIYSLSTIPLFQTFSFLLCNQSVFFVRSVFFFCCLVALFLFFRFCKVNFTEFTFLFLKPI